MRSIERFPNYLSKYGIVFINNSDSIIIIKIILCSS